jgi:hypothetical protein
MHHFSPWWTHPVLRLIFWRNTLHVCICFAFFSRCESMSNNFNSFADGLRPASYAHDGYLLTTASYASPNRILYYRHHFWQLFQETSNCSRSFWYLTKELWCFMTCNSWNWGLRKGLNLTICSPYCAPDGLKRDGQPFLNLSESCPAQFCSFFPSCNSVPV